MKDSARKAMFSNMVKTKAKVGFHNGLNYTNEHGDNLDHVGKFFVDKDGRIINLNRNYDNNGNSIVSRQMDSTKGVSTKIRGYDWNKRVPESYTRKGIRTSNGKLIKHGKIKHHIRHPMDME